MFHVKPSCWEENLWDVDAIDIHDRDDHRHGIAESLTHCSPDDPGDLGEHALTEDDHFRFR
jgi:hypothetical protein